MSNENDSNNNDIHHSTNEEDMQLLCEYYGSLQRQGPGSAETTRQALRFMLDDLPKDRDLKIADLGCGTGCQTMDLAKSLTEQNLTANIQAIDFLSGFIDILETNTAKHPHIEKVKIEGVVGSMEDLHMFEKEELDLIWSEGAIYNMGFRKGLQYWNQFLKPGGYVAVSEITWFTNERPDEINDFWNKEYSEMDTISKKVQQIQDEGYIPVASFIIPESCWIDNYYNPQIQLQEEFLKKRYPNNDKVKEMIDGMRQETELYNKFKEYYGYVFYVAKKV